MYSICLYHTGFNNGFFILSCLLCLNRTCLMPVAQKINRNRPQHHLALQIQPNPNLLHTYPLLCQLWRISAVWRKLLRCDHLKSTVLPVTQIVTVYDSFQFVSFSKPTKLANPWPNEALLQDVSHNSSAAGNQFESMLPKWVQWYYYILMQYADKRE